MPIFFTPGQFARHADLYRRLGQLLAAGLPATNALQQLYKHPPGRAYRKPIATTLAGIEQGKTLSEASRDAGSWLPPIDLALIEAGESSGRLEASFSNLADYYDTRAEIARSMLVALAYPVFLLHAAVIILAFPAAFLSGNWMGMLMRIGAFLLPIYAVVALGIYAGQSSHGETWRRMVEGVVDFVPVLGRARREMALARLAMSLEALLSAGVTVVEAWQLAAASCGSPALRHKVESWGPGLAKGLTPGEMVQESRRFPEVFASQYATGEISGKLDENLRRLHKYYQDAASNKLHQLARWVPIIVYLGVAGYIAFQVLKFWSGYFQNMGNYF